MPHPLHHEIERKLKKVRFGHVNVELARKQGFTSHMTIIKEVDHKPETLQQAAQIIFDALLELSTGNYDDCVDIKITMRGGKLLKATVASKERFSYPEMNDAI